MGASDWEFADAWVLLAARPGGRRGQELSCLIAVADAYNQDIPTEQVIERSVGRLIASGLATGSEDPPPQPPRRADKGRRRLRHRLWPIALLLFAGSCGSLFVAEAVIEAHGHSIDPTDPMNFDTFRLANDSTRPLFVRLCLDQKCRRFQAELDWEEVAPRRAVIEDVYWGETSPQMFAVATAPRTNAIQGCLPLDARRRVRTTIRVALSSAVSCDG